MPSFMVVNPDGLIARYGSTTIQDISIQAKGEQIALPIPEEMSETSYRLDALYYVKFSAGRPALTERPVFDVNDILNGTAGGTLKITDLPVGTKVTYNEQTSVMDTTTLDLDTLSVGVFELSLELFPYVSKKIRIIVT